MHRICRPPPRVLRRIFCLTQVGEVVGTGAVGRRRRVVGRCSSIRARGRHGGRRRAVLRPQCPRLAESTAETVAAAGVGQSGTARTACAIAGFAARSAADLAARYGAALDGRRRLHGVFGQRVAVGIFCGKILGFDLLRPGKLVAEGVGNGVGVEIVLNDVGRQQNDQFRAIDRLRHAGAEERAEIGNVLEEGDAGITFRRIFLYETTEDDGVAVGDADFGIDLA